MKKQIILITLLCASFWHIFAQGGTTVKYHPENHTLTLKAQGAEMGPLVERLSAQGIQLYFDGLPEGLQVDADLTDTPVDEALGQIMPEGAAYFYRISPEAEAAIGQRKATITAMPLQMAQKSKKTAMRAANRPQMAPPEDIRSQPELQQLQAEASRGRERRSQGQAMSTNRSQIAAEAGAGQPSGPRLMSPLPLEKKKQHLVVLFKVTKNTIEPVGASMEPGAYQSSAGEDIRGDYAIIGFEDDDLTVLEGMADPLEARSIFDPTQDSDHGAFQQEEAFIAVKMPEAYAKPSKARQLSLQLVPVGGASKAAFIEKARSRRANAMESSRSMEVVRTVQGLDLSRIQINNQ